MLIELHESVIKNNNLDSEAIRLSIENIAMSMREKKHIVMANRDVLITLARCEELDRKARNVFANILRKSAIIGSIKKYLEGYISVRGDIEHISLCKNSGITLYNVPVTYFDDSEKLLPFHIICEDESDYKFYTSIGKKYLRENRYGFNVCFRGVHGGGEKTHSNYKTYLTEYNRSCLAIADSDKKDINCNIGGTARKVEQVYNKFKSSFITDIHILGVREKENLISPELYSLCSTSKCSKIELEILNYIYKNKTLKNLYIYTDIKDGIKYKEIFQNNINYKCVLKYLNECYQLGNKKKIIEKMKQYNLGMLGEYICEVMDKYKDDGIDLNLISKDIINSFEKENEIDYEDKIINGIGYLVDKFYLEILEGELINQINKKEKIQPKTQELENEIMKLQKNLEKSKKIFDIIDEEMKIEWQIIAKKIITWTCAICDFVA